MKIKALLSTCAAIVALTTPALAEFPERALELTIPASAGGGTDTSSRKLAILLEEALGQSIAILNVSGSGGAVGATQFMQAKPDGYSLFATWNSPLTTVPQVQSVEYSLDSFTPIASTSETAYTLCVKADFPATDGAGFLAELAANPDKYTYANDGIGGTMQLAAERIFQAKGIKAVPIPFGGALSFSLSSVAGPFLSRHAPAQPLDNRAVQVLPDLSDIVRTLSSSKCRGTQNPSKPVS